MEEVQSFWNNLYIPEKSVQSLERLSQSEISRFMVEGSAAVGMASHRSLWLHGKEWTGRRQDWRLGEP